MYVYIYMYETTRIPCTQTYINQISIYLFKPRKQPKWDSKESEPVNPPPPKKVGYQVFSFVFLPYPWNFATKAELPWHHHQWFPPVQM